MTKPDIRIRESSPDIVPDRDATEGTPAWAAYWHVQAMDAIKDAKFSGRILRNVLGKLHESGAFQILCDQWGRPFDVWEQYCRTPQPHGLGYEPAAIDAIIRDRESATVRRGRAADATTGEVLPEGRPEKLGNLPSFSQESRAQQAGISPRSQRKLDKLARLRPDLFERVRAEGLAVSRACILAGWEKEQTRVEPSGDGLIRVFDRLPAVEQQKLVARVRRWISDNEAAP